MNSKSVYLDCNATHPMLAAVRTELSSAILNDSDVLANPSSIHRKGQRAKEVVYWMRENLRQMLGGRDAEEFLLLSGATEALNLALRGFVDDRLFHQRKVLFVYSSVEHKAVLETIQDLKERYTDRVNAIEVPVFQNGDLNLPFALEAVEAAIAKDSLDVCFAFQIANNETGKVFDLPVILPKLLSLVSSKNSKAWVCLDGAQALAKLPDSHLRSCLHFADYAAFSAHKVGGPMGIGALWMRPNSPFRRQQTGGVQERSRRAGTHNMVGILGFLKALEDWRKNGEQYRSHLKSLRSKLYEGMSQIKGLKFHAEGDVEIPQVLPNTINFHVEGCPEESLLLALDIDGFFLSSGSACNSGSLKPSHVLTAMGYSKTEALSSLRVCVGVETTTEEVDAFLEALHAKVVQIRRARQRSQELLADAP